MKYLLLITLALCSTATVQAASTGNSTKAEFLQIQKAKYVAKGWQWNQASVEAIFNDIDTNRDGVASGAEKQAYWSKGKGAKSAPLAAPVASAVKLKNGDSTKEMYIAIQKKRWESKGWNWNQDKVEAEFYAIDTNKDGIASGLEKKAYWAAK